MKVQEMKDLFVIINANIKMYDTQGNNYIPYGIDTLTEKQLDIFDAEMDKYISRKLNHAA